MKKLSTILCAALAFSLAGCAEMQAGWTSTNTAASASLKATQKNVQGTNDNVAQAWADAGCAIPYGEVVRNGSGNPNLPLAVIELCGAPSGTVVLKGSTPLTTAVQSQTPQ